MADISMCIRGCKKQHGCYRWTAPMSDYQSVSDFRPDKDGNCEHYWDNEQKQN